MTALLYIPLSIVCSLVLIKAVKVFVRSVSKLARYLNISEYTVSFLLVALSTSLPEIIVGVTSAVNQKPILSFGNIVGANIALLTLIPAATILFGATLSTHKILSNHDIHRAFFLAVLPILLIIDGRLGRLDGVVLVCSYIFYSIMALRKTRGIESIINHFNFEKINVWKQSVLFVFSLLLILASSEGIVRAANAVSIYFKIDLLLIGLTLTALGTSLPELAFSIEAAREKKKGIILGDILGSIITNSTLVLGLVSLIYPINLRHSGTSFTAPAFFILALLVFARGAKTQGKIDRWEAGVLIFTYAIFVVGEYFFSAAL